MYALAFAFAFVREGGVTFERRREGFAEREAQVDAASRIARN